jgi:HSP20 family protein
MFSLIPRREKEKFGYPMARPREEFKTLYDRFFTEWPMLFEPLVEPERFWNLEMKETEKEVLVRAEVPGFEPADLDVELRNNLLIVKAEKKHETAKKDKGFEYAERRYERIVEVPAGIAPAKVEATYRNGVLEVHLPKTEEAKGLHIPVKATAPVPPELPTRAGK